MNAHRDDPAVQEVMEQLKPLADVYNMVEDNAISEKQMNIIIEETRKIREDFVK
jgi:uncharacterized protein YfkK (UPF0435 family)